MTSRRIATLIVAGAFGLPSVPAFAQAPADPAPKHAAVPKHAAAPKKVRAKKPAARAAAAPSPILGRGGEDEAASLERRRKAFFATKPDDGGPDQPSAPSAGVTLGGSGGISPGMGFKF